MLDFTLSYSLLSQNTLIPVKTLLLSCTLCGFVFLMAACDSAEPDPPVPLDVQTATDVEADPATGRDPNTGRTISNNTFTFFDLDAGKIVLSSSEMDAARRQQDSVATVWDIGFRGTTIIFNGGTSGPGSVVAQLLIAPFAEVLEAPAEGYVADGENTCPSVETPAGTFPGAPYVICGGSGNGWYNYDGNTLLILPIPGRTIALRTSEGHYAKIRILSYYQGSPNPPDPDIPARYYTFEYIVQPDGSRNFETTTAN